jgi:hypothetical protein
MASRIQPDFDLGTAVASDDMHVSFVPACFDDYLVLKKMSHIGSRPDTNSKLQSDYDLPM